MKADNKNTLIKYLRSLERKEFIRFRKFLSETKNNKRKRLIKLLELLENYALKHPMYNLAIQTQIYNELYTDVGITLEAIDIQQRNKLAANMTELTKLVERFLMYEALEKDEACQIKLLGRKLLDKNQIDLWTRFESKFRRKLKKDKINNFSITEKRLQLEILKLEYLENTGEIAKQDNLKELTLMIDQYWLLKKFEFHSSMLSLINLDSTKDYSNIAPLDAYFTLSDFYKQSKTTPDELVQHLHLNDTSLKLLTHPSEQLYNQLLAYLEKNKDNLTKDDMTDFFVQANNFCVFKIRRGDSTYKNKLLENYKTMNMLGVLTRGNSIQFYTLLNIVKLSCDNSDFNWAKMMIDKYASFINPSEQVSAIDLLYGAFYFYKGNRAPDKTEKISYYNKANNYIASVEKKNIPLRLNYKIMKVKLLYETDEQYNLNTILNFENTIKAIRRVKGLNDNHKKFSINFIKILIPIYQYKHKVTNTTLDEMKAKMDKMKAKNSGISNEQWLLEKIIYLT